MPTAIRFPIELNPPDRTGYAEAFRPNSRRFEREIGLPRQRRTRADVPLILDVAWTMRPADFRIFDRWYQDIIIGGEEPFDLQIDDRKGGLIWQTVEAAAVWEARRPQGRHVWIVSWQLRTIGAPFADRPPGTDELNARNRMGHAGRGVLFRQVALYGTSAHAHAGTGTLFAVPPVLLYGAADHGQDSGARFRNWDMFGAAEHEHAGSGELEELP